MKEQLNRIHQDQYLGAVVCSRAESYHLGIKLTKPALTAEKKYALGKEIMSIQHHNQVITVKAVIKDTFLEYDRNLFSEGPEPCSSSGWQCLLNRVLQLCNTDNSRLEEPISSEAAKESIRCLPASKCPGQTVSLLNSTSPIRVAFVQCCSNIFVMLT